MFPGLEKGLCVPFFKSRVTSRKLTVCLVLVYFDRDSQTVFAEDGTKLLLDQICLSGSCFGDSETIISVQTKIARITELLPYQVQQICANKFARLGAVITTHGDVK